MHDPRDADEGDVILRLGPIEQRVPPLGLTRDQFRRAFGAIAEQLGFAILGKACGKRVGVGGHMVNRGIGKAGKGHGMGVDIFALLAPFFGDGVGQRVIGQKECSAGRCFDRTPVEQDAPVFRDDDVLVKALHFFGPVQCRLSRTGSV